VRQVAAVLTCVESKGFSEHAAAAAAAASAVTDVLPCLCLLFELAAVPAALPLQMQWRQQQQKHCRSR
jgi:hypothetical protein